MLSFEQFLDESNKAANLKSQYYWKDGSLDVEFVGKNNYVILNSKGEALSKDGIRPMTAHSMKSAKEQAIYADGFKDHTWIKIYKKGQ